MESNSPDVEGLMSQIAKHENELIRLRHELAKLQTHSAKDAPALQQPAQSTPYTWSLKSEEYTRYGRQMILPEIGLGGQLGLKNASVLIVGMGGLGCPAAAYLSGAGVGTLGMMDGDTVEISNLHRQILHTTARVGESKVESAASSLKQLNPNVNYKLHKEHLTASTALEIFDEYDLVLDCTDHPTSRYLISDAAVMIGIPLVSGSALKTEGQLLVLNHPSRQAVHPGGPCYRCIFHRPPPAETTISCGEGGILGPVVGVMGVLMAIEAIKVLTSSPVEHVQGSEQKPVPHSMLIFSAFSPIQFRTLKMKGKRKDCVACSDTPSITKDSLNSGSLDYAVFCGLTHPVNVLKPDQRVSASDYALVQDQSDHVLLDVRDETQFGICSLENSINVPWSLLNSTHSDHAKSDVKFEALNKKLEHLSPGAKIYSICRFGNDSQLAVEKLRELGYDNGSRWIGDIRGGFRAWKSQVDVEWPEY